MRIAIFASGGGSNAEAIMQAAAAGNLSAEVVLCATNRPGAGVIDRAQRFGVPSVVIPDPDDAAVMLRLLQDHRVDAVALAGYMRRVPAEVVERFHHRILNIHPALLPAFGGKGMYGRHVHSAVIESGVRWSGATVHLVDEAYDTGPIVLQSPVPVLQDDTPETLAARILDVEHRLYPIAIRLFARNQIRVDGRRVLIDDDSMGDAVSISRTEINRPSSP